MTMHGPYGDYAEDDTSDLVRSLALSSAKLWEELFERLRRIETVQVELRELVSKIEVALPDALDRAAPERGSDAGPALPATTSPPSFEDALARVRADGLATPDRDGRALWGAGDGAGSRTGEARPIDHPPAQGWPRASGLVLDPSSHGTSGYMAPLGESAPMPVEPRDDEAFPSTLEWPVHDAAGAEGWPSAPPPVWNAPRSRPPAGANAAPPPGPGVHAPQPNRPAAAAGPAVGPPPHPAHGFGAEPPPPPPGYTIVRPAQHQTPTPAAWPAHAAPDGAPNSDVPSPGTGTEGRWDTRQAAEEPPRPAAINPDFFARAGRRRP